MYFHWLIRHKMGSVTQESGSSQMQDTDQEINSLTNVRTGGDKDDQMTITVTIPGNGIEEGSIKRRYPDDEKEQNHPNSMNGGGHEIPGNDRLVKHEALISKKRVHVEADADKGVSESRAPRERTGKT